MSTELSIRPSNEITVQEPNAFEMKPRTLEEAMKFCEIMADSDLVPKDYKGKPGNIMVAIQMGNELGLTPVRALRCIAVINGRASMWGDEMLAMVLASPVCEYVRESESTDKQGVCRVKRKSDAEEHVSIFTLEDAKRAGLLGKAGTWQTNTKRMLQLRARGFALRDKFADVLAGLITAEEALDIPTEQPKTEVTIEKPATLKERLKAQIESVSEPRQEDGAACSSAPVDEIAPQQGSDAPAPLSAYQAIIDRLVLAQSVKELAAVMNESLELNFTNEQRKIIVHTREEAMKRLREKK